MIDMTKKYRTREGLDVRILCVDGPGSSFTVAGYVGSLLTSWTAEGKSSYPGGRVDLIEVVPDVVRWTVINDNGYPFWSAIDLVPEGRGGVAILKTTIRNGGKSHVDVTVEVLPVDHKETP